MIDWTIKKQILTPVVAPVGIVAYHHRRNYETDTRKSMRYLALFTLVSLPAMAMTNVDLYRTEVVLEQNVKNADAQARVDGMKEIIVRASGDRSALDNDVVKKALSQNSQYLSQMSYGQINNQKTMQLVFSKPQIQTLLGQAKLPIWPAERANILVWLVEETQNDRSIAWEDSSSSTLQHIKQQAEDRGLPLTLPVGDFDDATGINVSDLWGGFAQPVGAASQRYPVDAVMVVRAQGDTLRWTLYDQKPNTIGVTRQAPMSGSAQGVDSANQMIDQISQYYAKNNAVVLADESSEAVKIRFVDLGNAVDFFLLEEQLKKLSSVASLDILTIQGQQVTFKAHLLTSSSEFEQQLSRMLDVTRLDPIIEVPAIEPQKIEPVIEATQPVANSANSEAASVEAKPAVVPVGETILLYEWNGAPATVPVLTEVTEQEAEPVDGIQDSMTL